MSYTIQLNGHTEEHRTEVKEKFRDFVKDLKKIDPTFSHTVWGSFTDNYEQLTVSEGEVITDVTEETPPET